MNNLTALHEFGQSFWYDNIRRKYLLDGTLQKLIDVDGLRGVTSNPSIFEKAIGGSQDYDNQIKQLVTSGADTPGVYEALVLEDIKMACDLFAPLYRSSDGQDGFVSLEVSPLLANDEEKTVAEARRLFAAVERPNVMIKVPATVAGVAAIRRLTAAGVNINVTLMFSMAHYEAVAGAYIEGLRERVASGADPSSVASVASFFVSRVDTAVDKQLESINSHDARQLRGKAAVANSKIVYRRFKEIFLGQAFESLRAAGARVQRLLWASTSTKNPDYPDTMYVDQLIGPQTVNTMPPATIDAFRDHGTVAPTLEAEIDKAQMVLASLVVTGINLEGITEQLQEDGVAAFAESYQSLLATLEQKATEIKRAG